MKDDLGAYLDEALKDPEFRAAWEDGHARDGLIDSLVNARRDQGISQSEVARRMKVRQPTVSQMENEGSDPRLSTVQRYARAIGKTIKFEVTDEN